MFVFIAYSFYFLLIIILSTSFGSLLLRLIKLNLRYFLENCLFSLIFSLVFLTLLSYALSIFKIQFLIAPFFWVLILLGLINGLYLIIKKSTFKRLKFDWALFFSVLFFATLLSLITIRSGWRTQDSLGFFGVNAHDGMWHLSLIGELKNHFPPQHPNFSGIELKGYHYLLDLFLAYFSKVFGFWETDLYFRFFPFLTAVLWCLLTFFLAQKYFQNKTVSYLTIFFSVLGGSFAYLLPIFHPEGINFDAAFGVSAPISSLINLQFAFSIPILVLTFHAFDEFLQGKGFGWGLLVILFTGALFGFKIYAGLIALFVIGISSFLHFIKQKKISILSIPILSGLLGVLIYLPASTKGAGLVFAPGEMVQSIIRGPFSWTLWEIKRQIYAEHNNLFGLLRLRIYAFLVFILGNLGTKILGVGEFLRFSRSRILSKDYGLFFSALIFSFLMPLLFIQSITPFNIVQFWWYFLYFMSFPTAIFVWDLLKGKKVVLKIFLLTITFILTVPAATFVLSGYLFPKTSYVIPQEKLKVAQFLKENTNPDDVILEIPSGIQIGKLNFDLPIIPAFAQRRVFLGQEMIEFPYLDKKRREEEVRKIVAPLNCQFLTEVKIKNFCQKETTLSYKTLYENSIDYVFSPYALFWLEENSKISSLVYNYGGFFIYKIEND